MTQPTEQSAFGERLKLFRLARAMTLGGLADATGRAVTKQALSKYERGLMLPSPSVLRALAVTLGVRASELLAPPSIQVEILAFRKLSRLAKKEQHRVEGLVSRMLEQRCKLQQAGGQDDGREIPLLRYRPSSLQDCESFASSVRNWWSLGEDPIPCMVDTLEEHHIHVLELVTEATIDGLAAVARDGGVVKAAAVVSRKGLPGERQRLNLAHELGHLVLQATAGVDSEKAAFRFAAAFLAPEALVRRDAGNFRRNVSLGELLLLKQRYGMSVQALVYRLSDLGIISESHATMLWKQINARDWKRKEPGALQPERPQWARRTALRAIAEKTLTIGEAEEIIGIRIERSTPSEVTDRRDLMKQPSKERLRRLRADAERAASDYIENTEWQTLLGGDLLPDE